MAYLRLLLCHISKVSMHVAHAAPGQHPSSSRLRGAQGGIVYSNAVTTVSPTYARESLEGGAAGWLRATLAKPEVRAKFTVRSYS